VKHRRGEGKRASWRWVGSALALAGMLLAGSQAAAQVASSPGGAPASTPNPATTPIGAAPAQGETSQRDQPNTCTLPIAAAIQGGDSRVVIALDPETLWRPRGSEVRFTIEGSGLSVQNVQVCFAWSHPVAVAASAATAPSRFWDYSTSPLVRPIPNAEGKIEYGAIVPDLLPVPSWWPRRALGTGLLRFTGLFIVPIADMQVLATVSVPGVSAPGVGTLVVARVLPVGITSAWYALVLVLLVAAGACVFLWLVARWARLPGRSAALKVISTADGFASLSQFQIVLWTLVVGAAAVYVMTLSGNLIGITSGTLVLLGIAGATTLLARVPTAGTQPNQPVADAGGQADPPALVAGGQVRAPQWSDLIVARNGPPEIDVTRVQMLAFTLISAVFVGIKVLVSYEIPAIPEGFLLLMGISNGVYITGRHLPGTA
jgi:hypothetical protein